MSLFSEKNIKPMLIGAEGPAFDDPNWIYELKLDGVRCIAYLDKSGTELRNKRNLKVTRIYPELSSIHKQIRKPCILDGELLVMKDGKPFFAEIQRRALMSDLFKIQLAAAKLPVSFTAFDILWQDEKDLYTLPLMERKAILQKAVSESAQLSVSRYIEGKGTALYQLAEQQGLEGIVAKRKESQYFFDKRTKDWIKTKYLLDDDFVVCGYILKSDHMTSIVLGQYDGSTLIYKGHVTLGVSGKDFQRIKAHKALPAPPIPVPEGRGNEQAVWISPDLVCTVKFMERTANGGMRQPVFKGLREDKAAEDCKAL